MMIWSLFANGMESATLRLLIFALLLIFVAGFWLFSRNRDESWNNSRYVIGFLALSFLVFVIVRSIFYELAR
jgi:uncharacterized membrane protein